MRDRYTGPPKVPDTRIVARQVEQEAHHRVGQIGGPDHGRGGSRAATLHSSRRERRRSRTATVANGDGRDRRRSRTATVANGDGADIVSSRGKQKARA